MRIFTKTFFFQIEQYLAATAGPTLKQERNYAIILALSHVSLDEINKCLVHTFNGELFWLTAHYPSMVKCFIKAEKQEKKKLFIYLYLLFTDIYIHNMQKDTKIKTGFGN